MKLRQCAKCPWKVTTDPNEIPNGYSVELHKKLDRTIAKPGSCANLNGAQHVMACHESPIGKERYCAGWLAHQLGPGNNIALRLRFMGEKLDLKLDGEQHERFEDTLP